ncbi:transcription elongation factor spt4 [Neodidymelliopsis sp. IMI 364377]|nr:transcription elongation factor spt4 [Neodidymelliopsis sp. IMI 364377]
MPPRRGLATRKKADSKYIYRRSNGIGIRSPTSSTKSGSCVNESSILKSKGAPAHEQSYPLSDVDDENIKRVTPPKLSKVSSLGQPCQDLESLHLNQLQHSVLANALFPRKGEDTLLQTIEPRSDTTANLSGTSLQTDSPFADFPRVSSSASNANAQTEPTQSCEQATKPGACIEHSVYNPFVHSHVHRTFSSDPPIYEFANIMANMIPGGAFVPPNQQRNLRACMVCSIVRTFTQFMNGGCPNCEDLIELTGNSENVNDCTSQVFEGMITVADTSKSWVARYQRLEGYVPGVYATQVEGILPEEIVSAIEAAGINYVPRDGSETEMLPKD